ncbi:MAG: hypothetical protein ABIK28_07725 [Planctomycetota bacterium]
MRLKARKEGIDDGQFVALTQKIERKVLFSLGLEGTYIDHAEQQGDPLPFQSPLLKECYTASIQGRVGLGTKAGAYVHREGSSPRRSSKSEGGNIECALHGFRHRSPVRPGGEAPVIRAILKCLKLPADPPVRAEARWLSGYTSIHERSFRNVSRWSGSPRRSSKSEGGQLTDAVRPWAGFNAYLC